MFKVGKQNRKVVYLADARCYHTIHSSFVAFTNGGVSWDYCFSVQVPFFSWGCAGCRCVLILNLIFFEFSEFFSSLSSTIWVGWSQKTSAGEALRMKIWQSYIRSGRITSAASGRSSFTIKQSNNLVRLQQFGSLTEVRKRGRSLWSTWQDGKSWQRNQKRILITAQQDNNWPNTHFNNERGWVQRKPATEPAKKIFHFFTIANNMVGESRPGMSPSGAGANIRSDFHLIYDGACSASSSRALESNSCYSVSGGTRNYYKLCQNSTLAVDRSLDVLANIASCLATSQIGRRR